MIHIYTGNGKGKTTAGTGLIMRALGAGFSPIIIRFIKNVESSEDVIIRDLSIPVEVFGTGFIINKITDDAIEMARNGLKRLREIIRQGEYNIILLDEINVAVDLGVVSDEEVLEILDMVSADMEIILTGRGATKRMMEKADLVTEMKDIKHYYQKGVSARKGIEY
ncbi:cob(I)yrinic acid a,c-diamide adenosyltransferase [candidate division WOR-3 bacterium]|nr:cob(I)yrinic acid a,c-diamide adenosyltransferase [candidate division WOR-3 bacterium]